MAATGLQLNWSGVEFATTPITRVTSMTVDQGGEAIAFNGDNDRYDSVIARNVSRPSVQITSGDVATMMGLAGQGTITGDQLDALGATSGGVTWTIINAVHVTTNDSGAWGNFATSTATFRCYAADGQTNPLSLART
jgi:hypothetical protein